ncbi:MAG: FixH family protein [Mariprofundaceae bacterium]|nr:FixH family protein [Mariprofundaceae bacterium]
MAVFLCLANLGRGGWKMVRNTANSHTKLMIVMGSLFVIVLFNMSVFFIAQSLNAGDVDYYYQQYRGALAQPEASDDHFDLVWPEQIYAHTDNEVILHAKTFYGQAIDISSSRVHFYRPSNSEQDIDAILVDLEGGTYKTTINFSAEGLWHMHMLLTYQGQQHFLDEEFVVVRQHLSLSQRNNALGPKKEKLSESWSGFFIRVLLARAKQEA